MNIAIGTTGRKTYQTFGKHQSAVLAAGAIILCLAAAASLTWRLNHSDVKATSAAVAPISAARGSTAAADTYITYYVVNSEAQRGQVEANLAFADQEHFPAGISGASVESAIVDLRTPRDDAEFARHLNISEDPQLHIQVVDLRALPTP